MSNLSLDCDTSFTLLSNTSFNFLSTFKFNSLTSDFVESSNVFFRKDCCRDFLLFLFGLFFCFFGGGDFDEGLLFFWFFCLLKKVFIGVILPEIVC